MALVNGYVFYQEVAKDCRSLWRCPRTKSCKARFWLIENEMYKAQLNHNHEVTDTAMRDRIYVKI